MGRRDLGELGERKRAFDAIDGAVGGMSAGAFINEFLTGRDKQREVGIQSVPPTGLPGGEKKIMLNYAKLRILE